MSYTAGPWKAVWWEDEGYLVVTMAGDEKRALATLLTEGEEPTENDWADAILMAAAPEMWALLAEIQEMAHRLLIQLDEAISVRRK